MMTMMNKKRCLKTLDCKQVLIAPYTVHHLQLMESHQQTQMVQEEANDLPITRLLHLCEARLAILTAKLL